MKFRFVSPFCLCILALLGAPSFALPLLSEVFYDAAGSDGAEVFTEIAGEPGFRLDH